MICTHVHKCSVPFLDLFANLLPSMLLFIIMYSIMTIVDPLPLGTNEKFYMETCMFLCFHV